MDPPLDAAAVAGRKRSRFDAAPAPPVATQEVAIAQAKAAAQAASLAAAQQTALLRAQQLLSSFGVAPSFLPSGFAAVPQEESNKSKRTVLPPPLVLDAQGKAVDGVDQLMSIPVVPVTTLKINASTRVAPVDPAGARPSAQIRRAATDAAAIAAPTNKYLANVAVGDESVTATSEAVLSRRQVRASRGLKFVETGKYAAEAEEMRAQAERLAALASFRKKGSRTRPLFHAEFGGGPEPEPGSPAEPEASVVVSSTTPTTSIAAKQRTAPPAIEWWDAAFLSAADRKVYTARYSVAGAKKAAAAAASGQAGAAPAMADDEPCDAAQAATGGGPDTALGAGLSYAQLALSHSKTWQYVEHPEAVLATLEASSAPIVVPLMLTHEERKRRRRTERAARLKERQDQIRLGLLPPEEPKVRLSNLYRVLKDSAVADPSAVEAKVRAQVAQRQKAHEMGNLARKLTPAERRDKWKRKMTEGFGVNAGTDAALFRVSDLGNKQARYKIDVNAQQNFLTGVVLLCRPARANLVYVEGSARAVRKYVRLMAQRIDWVQMAAASDGDRDAEALEEADDDGDELGDPEARPTLTPKGCGTGPGSLCEVVWHGHAAKRHFLEWRFEEVRNVMAARRLLEAKGLAHLWDQVLHSARLAAGEEPGGSAIPVAGFAAAPRPTEGLGGDSEAADAAGGSAAS